MSRMGDLVIFHQELECLSSTEFENEVFRLISNDSNFKNFKRTQSKYDGFFDFKAEEINSENKVLQVVFQIKRIKLITLDIINDSAKYWLLNGLGDKLYIVTDGEVKEEARRKASELNIEVWSIYNLYYLSNAKRSSLNSERKIVETKEEAFTRILKETLPGRQSWSTYQKLSGDIFTHIFCPPLFPPRIEHSDAAGRNRRDLIYENTSNHTYWKMIRSIYKADYIIVDAKNYQHKLDKEPILDIAHYLKPYGVGMFGIILSRLGAGDSAIHALKEQWINNNKMIIILNDNDILDMLKMKQSKSEPEEVIRTKIAEFRMSL